MNINRLTEQVIAGLVVAGISAIVSVLLSDKINFVLVFLGFVAGVIGAMLFFRFYGSFPSPNLSSLLSREESNGTITATQLEQMLFGQASSDRVETIEQLLPDIASNLTAEEVGKIIFGVASSDRVKILEALSPKIEKPLSPEGINTVLFGMASTDRTKASAILARRR